MAWKNEVTVCGLGILQQYINKEINCFVYNTTDDDFAFQPSFLKASVKNEITVTSIEESCNIDGLLVCHQNLTKLYRLTNLLMQKCLVSIS